MEEGEIMSEDNEMLDITTSSITIPRRRRIPRPPLPVSLDVVRTTLYKPEIPPSPPFRSLTTGIGYFTDDGFPILDFETEPEPTESAGIILTTLIPGDKDAELRGLARTISTFEFRDARLAEEASKEDCFYRSFDLKISPEFTANFYKVTVNPQIWHRKKLRQVFQSRKDPFKMQWFLTEKSELVVPKLLVVSNMDFFWKGALENEALTNYLVSFKLIRTETYSQTSKENVEVVNWLFHKILQDTTATITLQDRKLGSHYFCQEPVYSEEIPNFLQLSRGFLPTVLSANGQIVLQIKPFLALLDCRNMLVRLHRMEQNSTDCTWYFRWNSSQVIQGESVFTKYNKKMYTLKELPFGRRGHDEFNWKGMDVSYATYYEKLYRLKVQFPFQVVLIPQKDEDDDENEKPLLPELCHHLRIRKVTNEELNRETNPTGWSRQQWDENMRTFVSNVMKEAEMVFNEWGIALQTEILKRDSD